MSSRPATRARVPEGDRRAHQLVAAEQRFADRGRRGRRRTWLRVVGIVLAVGLVVGLAWLVFLSPVFAVRTVAVTGVPASDVARIRSEAAVPVGVPLVRLDISAAAQRVAKDPRVAHVSVHRGLTGTVTVEVTLRRPVLTLRSPQGDLTEVDIQGVPFRAVATAPSGIPVLTTQSDGAVTEDGIRAALALVGAVRDGVKWQPRDLSVDPAGLLSFTVGSTHVVWGSAERPHVKVEIVSALLKQHPKLIDVSAPDTPVTR